jgi:uncharacterized lipoprotein YmbA
MKALIICCLSLWLAACSSAPTITYYQLNFQSAKPYASANNVLKMDAPSLMGHLSSRGIAMRLDEHRTVNANYHLWSSLPAEQLHQAGIILLQNQLSDFIVVATSQDMVNASDKPSYLVKLNLYKFNGRQDGNSEIAGAWQLFKDDKNRLTLLKSGQLEITEPLENDGYTALVASLDRNYTRFITALSKELNAAL